MDVYVLLFSDEQGNEGIHTLKEGDRNIVLMFEVEDDATRFSLLLEAQDFPPAAVEKFDADDIESFCQEAGYDCALVPEGALAVPPESNAQELDWDPATDNNQREEAAAASDGESEISNSELDRIRQQLEKLL